MAERKIDKVAKLFLLVLLTLIQTEAHREAIESDQPDSSSDMESEPIRRSNMVNREWQYEGLPIESSLNRRAENLITDPTTTTTTTTTTTKIYPPLDPRYRRIFNPDEKATIEEFPFMAALLMNKQLWCGAVVIDRDRVLTAAHCLQLQYNNRFFREYVKMLTVRVGSTNATFGGEVLRVVEISFHPNYKPDTLEFNVAVLKLHKNITYGNKDAPVEKLEYSKETVVPVDHNITFLGWGSVLGPGGSGGRVLLQKLELPVYDLPDCQEVYGRELVTRHNFCAGYITVSKNVCNVTDSIGQIDEESQDYHPELFPASELSTTDTVLNCFNI